VLVSGRLERARSVFKNDPSGHGWVVKSPNHLVFAREGRAFKKSVPEPAKAE